MLALGLSLAALIGLSLGLLGGGGSILTVPVLVYVLGYAAKPAIAMSLPIVGVTSLFGALLHWRLGNVRVGVALLFGAIAMAGAYAGARLAPFVSGGAQLVLLALLMLGSAVSMFRGTRQKPGVGTVGSADAAATPAAPPRRALVAVVALAVGVITGLVGIGGGFLFVPALVLLAGIPMRQAVGTSLLVIAMNSAAGFAGYLGTVPIDWTFLAGFATIAIVGALAGTMAASRVPQAALKRAFAVFLVAVGGFVLYRNRSTFTGGDGVAQVTVTQPAPAR